MHANLKNSLYKENKVTANFAESHCAGKNNTIQIENGFIERELIIS